MNSNGFNQNQACSENNEFDFNQFTFNYNSLYILQLIFTIYVIIII